MTKNYNMFYEKFLESTMARPRAKIVKTNVQPDGTIEKKFVQIVRESKNGAKALHLMKRVWDEGESYVVSFEPCYSYFCDLDGSNRTVSVGAFVKKDGGFELYNSSEDGSIWGGEQLVKKFDDDDLTSVLDEMGYELEKSPQYSTMTLTKDADEDTNTPVPHDEEDEDENTDTPEPEDD